MFKRNTPLKHPFFPGGPTYGNPTPHYSDTGHNSPHPNPINSIPPFFPNGPKDSDIRELLFNARSDKNFVSRSFKVRSWSRPMGLGHFFFPFFFVSCFGFSPIPLPPPPKPNFFFFFSHFNTRPIEPLVPSFAGKFRVILWAGT